MGRVEQFNVDNSPAVLNGGQYPDTDAKHYITDLLSELQMIANVSGLSRLSDDIQNVLSKHMPKTG